MERSRARAISFGEFVRRAIEKRLLVKGKRLRNTGGPFLDNLIVIYGDGPDDFSTRDDKLHRRRRTSGVTPRKRPVSQRSAPVVANHRPTRRNEQPRHW
jgi:hypothetical protein